MVIKRILGRFIILIIDDQDKIIDILPGLTVIHPQSIRCLH
jgi:hypothetical protein